MLSLMLDRNFRIEITHPCNVSHALRPSFYDWGAQIPEFILTDPTTNKLRYRLTRKMIVTTANARIEVINNVSEILSTNRSIDSLWSEDILYWASNKDYFHQMSNNIHYRKKFKSYGIMTKYDIKLETLFPFFYEILFRPIDDIQEQISNFRLKKKDQPIICAQIRTGKFYNSDEEKHSIR